MARSDRKTTLSVDLFDALSEAPHQLNFFQVMRRLECIYSDNPRLGESHTPEDEAIRLGQVASLAFAPSALASFERGRDGLPPRLLNFFFGLLGPNGPLPMHLTDYARERQLVDKDSAFVRFLDVFNHRMMLLLYRAWANAQPTVSHDRPKSDRFGTFVGTMFGVGTEDLSDRDAMPDIAKLHFAARLACQTRNADGLEAIVGDYFRVVCQIEQFVGNWIRLPKEYEASLMKFSARGQLGLSAVVGPRVWDRQSKFRVVLGPLGFQDYQRFLPDGQSLVQLAAIAKNYVGDELLWDLNLILQKSEVPRTKLDGRSKLGWTTWLVSAEPTVDRADLRLNPTFSHGPSDCSG